jgi:hypothetical protein
MSTVSENAQRLAELFVGNDQWRGSHGVPEWDEVKSKWGIRSTARTLSGGSSAEHWQQHLDGGRPLGVVPVRLEGERTVCRWGCGDVDDYEIDVVAIVARVEQMGYPLVPCRSKSGGLHLFLFLKDWEDPAAVQAVLRDMMASLGHASAEIFPKQSHLVDERDKGSWIVVPYFGGDFDGKLTAQRGVKSSGSDMMIEEFIAAAEAARTTTAEIKVRRAPRPSAQRSNHTGPRVPGVPFGDGPPCLEYLAEHGVPPGGQNNALLMMGLYYQRADSANWKARLERANTEYLRPPGSADGVLSVIRSLEKKEYNYTCRAEPMRSFCNSRLCRGRTHGVGEGSEVPKIAHLLQRQGHEKQWIVQVSGIRLTLTTMEFQEFRRFRLRALDAQPEAINFAPMKEADWSALVSAAMSTVMDVETEEEQTPDVRSHYCFHEMFETYTSNRAQARSMTEMVGSRGKPWQDVEAAWGLLGWWYVHIPCFERAAAEMDKTRQKWSRGYIIDRFKEMGAVPSKRDISGRRYSVWGFPPEAIQKPAAPVPVRSHLEEKI